MLLKKGDFMKQVFIDTEYITLGKFLKYVNAVSSGIEAKIVILNGEVLVNGEVDMRRGKKLRHDDVVSFDGIDYIVKNED